MLTEEHFDLFRQFRIKEGSSSAAWFSGMCSTLVEYCPLRP